ncbi:unnamed protein product [Notodromas monacha]|uniref:Uncharacterized protein n=1 Tax=Notodromas monacha TaxID=399045 RepID=A0A7R9GJG2_9CRUS|nr:unnamed protein product [Notodromas monacha]CAG0924839.1 unnamed protein product [Notodromas monacha]
MLAAHTRQAGSPGGVSGPTLMQTLVNIAAPKFFDELFRRMIPAFFDAATTAVKGAMSMGRNLTDTLGNLDEKYIVAHLDLMDGVGDEELEQQDLLEDDVSFRDAVFRALDAAAVEVQE